MFEMIFIRLEICLYVSISSGIWSQEIDVGLGRLRGSTLTARNKKNYYAYYGIPYAKPPVGKLRFEPPVPYDLWNGTLDATTARAPCPQMSEDDQTIYKGVEDCLYLDIYTPEKSMPGRNYPVVFYVFGGLFKYGSTVREGESFFMGRDIIIVRTSYRLGVLGFLSTGDTTIPGNMGMKDLAMALNWTKKNIYDFGGDPHRITLHGHSTGAASVHLLTLSPLSKDNYDRVILQSGLGTAPHLFIDRYTATGITRGLAEKVNCSVQSSEYLKDCLQNKTAEELVTMANKLHLWKTEPQTIFRPTIEDKNVVGAFLVTHPLLTPYPTDTKPWIIGMTSGESLAYIHAFEDDFPLLGDKVTLPIVGAYEWTTKLSLVDYVEQLTRTHFLGNGPTRNRTGLMKMFNGIMHGMGILDAVQKYKGPKFVYLFDYKGLSKNLDDEILGIGHAIDLQLIFVRPNKKSLTEEDVTFGEEMITRWVNFYYSGNPNIPFKINTSLFSAWDPMTSPLVEYLCINRTGTMRNDYFVNEFGWWKKLPFFNKYTDPSNV